MSGNQMIREEEVQLGGGETQGTVLMAVGKLLLWTSLIFLAFHGFPRHLVRHLY